MAEWVPLGDTGREARSELLDDPWYAEQIAQVLDRDVYLQAVRRLEAARSTVCFELDTCTLDPRCPFLADCQAIAD